MIKSMTAFARVQQSESFGTLTWELRSVNSRYLDINCRLPEDFRAHESRVRESITRRLQRGKVECALRFIPELAVETGIEVNAALVNGLGPLITGLLAVLLIGESMTGRQVAGAVIGLMGVIVLISGGSLTFWAAMRGSVGDLIVLGAVTLWGFYSVLGRRVMHQRSALSATAFSIYLGLPLLILAAVWELQVLPVTLHPELLLAVLYIGIAPTVIGFLAWNIGVRRLGPAGAMIFFNRPV